MNSLRPLVSSPTAEPTASTPSEPVTFPSTPLSPWDQVGNFLNELDLTEKSSWPPLKKKEFKKLTQELLASSNLPSPNFSIPANIYPSLKDAIQPILHKTLRKNPISKTLLPLVKLFLADPRTDINQVDPDERTPFLLACQAADNELIKILLANPSTDLNKPDIWGDTPLSRACSGNNTELVELLLKDQRLDPNEIAEDRSHLRKKDRNLTDLGLPHSPSGTAFERSLHDSSLEIIQLLLNHPRVDVNKSTEGHQAPFQEAFHRSAKDRKEVLKLILESPRIDLNKAGWKDETALMEYCQIGYIDRIETLLKYPRVDVNIKDNEGKTALHHVAERPRHDNIDRIKTRIRLLLAYPHIDPNPQDNQGNTPLHLACGIGIASIVEILLADPRISLNVQNLQGSTPFYRTCAKFSQTHLNNGSQCDLPLIIERFLLDSRTDINLGDATGQFTPLYVAASLGRQETLDRLLIMPGIRVNRHYSEDKTPFIMAQKNNYTRSTDLLSSCFGITNDTPNGLEKNQLQKNVLEYVKSSEEWKNLHEFAHKIAQMHAHHLFCLTVFLCDDFLILRGFAKEEPSTEVDKTKRFFLIASKLPIELQMVLSNRLFGIKKDLISKKESEASFRYLATLSW